MLQRDFLIKQLKFSVQPGSLSIIWGFYSNGISILTARMDTATENDDAGDDDDVPSRFLHFKIYVGYFKVLCNCFERNNFSFVYTFVSLLLKL